MSNDQNFLIDIGVISILDDSVVDLAGLIGYMLSPIMASISHRMLPLSYFSTMKAP